MKILIVFILATLKTSHVIRAQHEEHKLSVDALRLRNEEEWKKAWHGEQFASCKKNAIDHVKLACMNDIYRMNRRAGKASPFGGNTRTAINSAFAHLELMENPFLSKEEAHLLFRSRRRASGISEECCYNKGCNWEEYAEYCPHTIRQRNVPLR